MQKTDSAHRLNYSRHIPYVGDELMRRNHKKSHIPHGPKKNINSSTRNAQHSQFGQDTSSNDEKPAVPLLPHGGYRKLSGDKSQNQAQLRRELEEKRRLQIREQSLLGKQEARETKAAILQYNLENGARMREEKQQKQDQMARQYQMMVQDRKQVQKEFDLKRERIRSASESRRTSGYWLSGKKTNKVSKETKKAMDRLHVSPRPSAAQRKTKAKNHVSIPELSEIQEKSGQSVKLDVFGEPVRKLSFVDVALRLMYAKRKYSQIKLRKAQKKQKAFEKPQLRSIDIQKLLDDRSHARSTHGMKSELASERASVSPTPIAWNSSIPSNMAFKGESLYDSDVSESQAYIAPVDCEDILQSTINQIKSQGFSSKLDESRRRTVEWDKFDIGSDDSDRVGASGADRRRGNSFQEMERLNMFIEELINRVKKLSIKSESEVRTVDVTDQLVECLSDEEFHMFRFCLDADPGNPLPKNFLDDPTVSSVGKFVNEYEKLFKSLWQMMGPNTTEKASLERRVLEKLAQQCLNFIQEHFGFYSSELKPDCVINVMSNQTLVQIGMKTFIENDNPAPSRTADNLPITPAGGSMIGADENRMGTPRGEKCNLSELSCDAIFEETAVDSILPDSEYGATSRGGSAGTNRGGTAELERKKKQFRTPRVIRKLKDKVAPRDLWQQEIEKLCVGYKSRPDVEKIAQLVDRYYQESDTFEDCYDWQKEKLLAERKRNRQEMFRQLWQMRNQIHLKKIGINHYFKEHSYNPYNHLIAFDEKTDNTFY